VKRAVTPEAVKKTRRADFVREKWDLAHISGSGADLANKTTARCTRRQRCVLDAALGRDDYPIMPRRQGSRLAAWKLSGQPPEP
jgi:hypothetical protein